jgi:predicted MFS family arabinose efflux permease
MVLIGRSSDRRRERRGHLVFACLLQALGMTIAGLACGGGGLPTTLLTIAGLSIGAIGAFGMFGPFWALPPALLTGTAVAASVAIINSIGNLFGGFVGPKAYTYLDLGKTLLIAAGLAIVGAIMSLFAPERPAPRPQPVSLDPLAVVAAPASTQSID